MIDWKLFFSTFALIFLAEIPDKTAFAVLLMSARHSAIAVFVGAASALAVQSAVAIAFGSLLALLPVRWVHLLAGIMFLGFAAMMWFKKEEPPEENDPAAGARAFWKIAGSAFLVVFIAEWGDITQLATATVVARYHEPLTIFVSSTLALWSVCALASGLGRGVAKVIHPEKLQKVAAVAFACAGLFFLLHT